MKEKKGAKVQRIYTWPNLKRISFFIVSFLTVGLLVLKFGFGIFGRYLNLNFEYVRFRHGSGQICSVSHKPIPQVSQTVTGTG